MRIYRQRIINSGVANQRGFSQLDQQVTRFLTGLYKNQSKIKFGNGILIIKNTCSHSDDSFGGTILHVLSNSLHITSYPMFLKIYYGAIIMQFIVAIARDWWLLLATCRVHVEIHGSFNPNLYSQFIFVVIIVVIVREGKRGEKSTVLK